MKKLKEGKGITLIALIITIVVLLILAGVAIGTLEQTDIIGRAKEATRSYNQAKDDEDSTLTKAEEEMEDIIANLNKEPAQSGIKVYLIEGQGMYILTPENQIKFFRNDSPVEEDAIYVTEGKGDWTILHEGFSNEEINNLEYLYNDDVKVIFAVTSDRNMLVFPSIDSDSKTATFLNSSETIVKHNEEYVSQYYNEEENVEYWYGKWDEFTRGNVTRSAGEGLYKVDYNNNTIIIYGKRDGTGNSWEKQFKEKFDIENKGTNPTDINVTLDGKPLTINANSLKFDYLLHSDYYVTCYFQDEKMYVDIDSKIVDGKELTSGYHAYTRIKYINTSLLPQ